MKDQVKLIIDKLELLPHPEGGFYRESYRASGEINTNSLDSDYSGARNYATAIYYLLTSNTFSAFHRIKQDETWHFYKGSPIRIHIIDQEGAYSSVDLGNDFNANQIPQFTVAGGVWFGATIIEDDSYSLVGCTVSPGFDFRDFELAIQTELIQQHPQHKNIISHLTHQ